MNQMLPKTGASPEGMLPLRKYGSRGQPYVLMTGFVTEGEEQTDCSLHRADIEGWSVCIQDKDQKLYHKRFHRESSAKIYASELNFLIGGIHVITQ